jgi:hypothetical protein
MPLQRSSATEAEIEQYRQGECHVFAVALHRAFGWAILVVLDEGEIYWQDPNDADNYIPSVVHAYAVDPAGTAWDIAGARPESEVAHETARWVHIQRYGSDECDSEGEIKVYVGSWSDEESAAPESIDRPLADYGERDVAEAAAVADRVLSALPGYPSLSLQPA